MEKKYKFITISMFSQGPLMYQITNNKSNNLLGTIEYYPAWRQLCFMPMSDTVYSVGCMEDIISFMKDLKEAPQ